jgi:hypothetical protein
MAIKNNPKSIKGKKVKKPKNCLLTDIQVTGQGSKKNYSFSYQDDIDSDPQHFSFEYETKAIKVHQQIIKDFIKKQKNASKEVIEQNTQNIPQNKTEKIVGGITYLQDNPAALKQRRALIQQLKLQGHPLESILTQVSQKFGVGIETIRTECINISNEIAKNSAIKYQEVISLHSLRYEELYKRFMLKNNHSLAMKMLRLKENLLGIHNEVVDIQINSMVEVGGEINKIYLTSRLSPGENKELKHLLSLIH